MNSNKVLFLFTKFYPYGSSEQYIKNEIKYLSENFYRVVLVPCEYFSGDMQMRSIPHNFEVLDLNKEVKKFRAKKDYFLLMKIFCLEFIKSRNKFWVLKLFRRHLGILSYQIKSSEVFCEILKKNYSNSVNYFYTYWMHNSSVMLGILKKRNFIHDFVCRGHAIDMYEFAWKSSRKVNPMPFYNFIFSQASKIISISEHGAKYLCERFRSDQNKVFTSRLGVEAIGINPFLNSDIFRIVSCSSINSRKNVDLVAQLVKSLNGKVDWVHFGWGEENEIYKIKKVLKDFPSTHSYQLKGNVPNEVILDFYKTEQINLFVNLSDAEGIPVSMMEAISFGIPVLGTRVYGTPEIACDETGFCFDFPLDLRKMSLLIETYKNDLNKQRLLRQSSYDFYLKNYSAKKNYLYFINNYLLN
ncbi:MAG: glycosyltransferase [Bacteroidota bacterium]